MPYGSADSGRRQALSSPEVYDDRYRVKKPMLVHLSCHTILQTLNDSTGRG